MKKIFYLLLSVIILAACKNSMNEPNESIIKNGKAQISIAAPTINAGGGSAVRRITGTLTPSGDEITFEWNAGDVVKFIFYANDQQIDNYEYTITAGDIQTDKSILIEVPVPEGTDSYDVACGPTTVPEKQYYSNGISKGTMRFEKKGCTFTSDKVYMDPAWSALIIRPDIQYTYTSEITEYLSYCTVKYGFSNITLKQTIGTEETTITYCSKHPKQQTDQPVKVSISGGGYPTTPFVIVVNPAEGCDLDITINYQSSLFVGDVTMDEEKLYDLEPQTPSAIAPINMYTTGQSVPTMLAGQAYEIKVLQSHPVNVHWITKQ